VSAGQDAKPGDWVLIRAQVVDASTKPEDILVELFSSNDQQHTVIRRDLIEQIVLPVEPPDNAVVLVNGFAYQRHANRWYSTTGQNPEGLTWAELCAIGRPELIHPA